MMHLKYAEHFGNSMTKPQGRTCPTSFYTRSRIQPAYPDAMQMHSSLSVIAYCAGFKRTDLS
jgi:AraC-like DNA-binding protein